MTLSEPRLPRFTGWLRPLVDAVARIRASVHIKLLTGFLVGALLLVALAVLSLVVIGRMNERVQDIDRLQVKTSRAQQMLYAVTAQSHYRAMALLTQDPKYNAQVVDQKTIFADLLDAMTRDDPSDAAVLADLRTANDAYAAASDRVVALYVAGDLAGASKLHLVEEHPDSHVLEASLHTLIDSADQQINEAQAAFESDRALLTNAVVAFSVIAVGTALLLGFVLSWAFILPIRKIGRALAGITAGDLTQRVDVPNGDEFGQLARDLNQTSARLTDLFEEQRALATRLEETNASLARASDAKSRFLASVSHELRTPMNAILGFTDALLGGVDGPLNPEQTASLGWVQRGGRDLLGLINEILDLSKIEAGRLTIDARPFDPRELVETVVARSRSLAAQKGLSFSWEDHGSPAEVVLDRQRVNQILVNLFGNALKFTREGDVRVETSGAAESIFRVAVRDSGPGIAPDLHEAIFEEFRQAEGEEAGTGLGLAISRRLARAMGGDITLDSAPGSGSTFYLTLPLDCRTEPDRRTGGRARSRVRRGSGAPQRGRRPIGRAVAREDGRRPRVPDRGLEPPGGRERRPPPATRGDPARRPDARARRPRRAPRAEDRPRRLGHPGDRAVGRGRSEVPDLADGYLPKPVRQDRLLSLLKEHGAGPGEAS